MATNSSSTLGRFAHLVGLRPSAAKGKAVETETEEDRDEEDEKPDADCDEPAKGDDIKDEPAGGKKGAKKGAKKKAEADEGDDDDEEGGDESDADETTDDMKKAVRMRERARCAAIFADPAAAANPGLAATVAFSTNLTRTQAVAVLKAGGATAEAPAPAKKSSLDRRMSAEPRGGVTAGSPQGPAPDSAAGLAARMNAASRKALGLAA